MMTQLELPFVSKEVWYLAHPVSGDPVGNAMRAVQWLRWLTERDCGRIYIAPWVATVLAFSHLDLSSPGPDGQQTWVSFVEDDEEIVRRTNGILLVGGRVSPGMARECAAAVAAGLSVVDWSMHATPDTLPHGVWDDFELSGKHV